MTLKSITRMENARDRFKAVFDDGTALRVTAAQIADFGLYSGLSLSDEDFCGLREGIERGSAKARALRIVGSRNISSRELERRLASKGERDEIASETVRWLEDIGIVNDAEYAGMIVRHYTGKGYGPKRVRDELYRRGIPRELWDGALEGLEADGGAAVEFLEKKLRGSDDKDDLRRAKDALYRRGFSSGEISSAVSRYIENLDELGDDSL